MTKKSPQKPQVGMQQQRTVDLAIREINEDERRVRVSFSSEMAVSRWYGQEVLCHDEGCIDLSRINEIGVALFNHKRDVVIGRIENAICNNDEKRTYADIIFDDDDESEKIYKKVRSGTLKGISVGYSVDVWEEVLGGKTSTNGRFMGPAYVATKWAPFEISVVSIPADESVGIGRDLENENNENNEGDERTMTNPIPTNPANQQEPNVENERQQAIKVERQRVTDINVLCREFGVESDGYINDGSSIDQVRAAILEELKTRNKPSTAGVQVTVTKDELDKFRDAATDSILLRGGVRIESVAEGSRDLRGMRLRDLAIECLTRGGKANAHRLDNDNLFREALSPDSQFASILSNSVNKSMATAYKGANTTFKAWTGKGSNSDFKSATHYQISEAGDLKRMSQTSEFTFDEMKDNGVSKAIATYGKEFGITRQALINDDLSILTKLPEAYVRAAGRGINKLVYQMLSTNPTIYDGVALFDEKGHKNIATSGSAITVESLSVGRAAMRKQKNIRGLETLNITPTFLIVSPDKETEAEQLINSIVDPTKSNQTNNPFSNKLQIVCDAELSGKQWYLSASPSDIDTIEVTYLNGDEMPKLESQVGFDYLGMKWRIFIDYGVTILDYRGLYKNNGN